VKSDTQKALDVIKREALAIPLLDDYLATIERTRRPPNERQRMVLHAIREEFDTEGVEPPMFVQRIDRLLPREKKP
jgi:hypothetical protein